MGPQTKGEAQNLSIIYEGTCMAKLTIKNKNGKERVHEIIDDVTTVGRASSNIIQINDEKASRQHFRIEKESEHFKVVDLGSTNGMRLNGAKFKGELVLRPGDQLSVGKTFFTFDGPELAALAEPAPVGGETVALDAVKPPPEPVLAEAPKFVIKVLDGRNPGETYELGLKPLTLGRHASNTIQIIDDAASNYHAEIGREPIGYVLADLGSTNGTSVKPKNKSEFEKIVKTPLSVGTQIRVGKTLLEFDNVGKAVEDAALFGTISLDPKILEGKLSGRNRGVSARAVGLMVVVVFAGVIWGVLALTNLDHPSVQPVKPPEAEIKNLILNGDFSQGTDDQGNPQHFKIDRGVPGIKVAVSDEVGHVDGKDKYVLQISKAGAKSPSTTTLVETRDTFAVDSGKCYEFSGWMKNDGDGLFGLSVSWIQGERSFSEYPVVLKDTQEWKEKSIRVTPPLWAQRARVGVFVQGKEGKAKFDQLCFQEKPGEALFVYPTIKFGGIAVQFEGTNGAFSVQSQTERVIEDGTLALVSSDEKVESDLAGAIEPQATQGSPGFAGMIFDFRMQELANYRVQARQGAAGVDLSVAVDPGEAGCDPQLRFNVIGLVALGEIEILNANGSLDKILSTEDKNFKNARSVQFNTGSSPQLFLEFDKPIEMEVKREGNRRKVVLKFKSLLQMSVATESTELKQKMELTIEDLQKTLQAACWGEAETKMKTLMTAYGARFPKAKIEADKAGGRLGAAWKDSQDEIGRALNALLAVPSVELSDAATMTVKRHQVSWNGSGKMDDLKGYLTQIEGIRKSIQNSSVEQEAESIFNEAQKAFDKKVFNFAKAMLNRIVGDPRFSKAKVWNRARDLLILAESEYQKGLQFDDMDRRLCDQIKVYLAVKNYKELIDFVEKNPQYMVNKDNLPATNKLLETARKKLLEKH